MFCKFHRENPKNLQRHRVRAIEKRRGSPNAYDYFKVRDIFRTGSIKGFFMEKCPCI